MTEPRSVRRLPGVIAVVIAVLALGFVDRSDRPPLTPSGARLATAFAPAASPPDSLTSTWYCPAGTATPGGQAEDTIVVFNPTQRRLRGTIDVVGSDGTRASRGITVEPRSHRVDAVGEILHNPFVAATVQLDGGGAVVEHGVLGPAGEALGACASSASTRWYMAAGATTRAATLVYALFNPFPDDAIVDLTFSTEQGRLTPAAFQGVVVPANSLVPLDVGSHVRRRAQVSASIRARRGRVVVEALQIHNGDGRKGIALTLGAPRTATSFVFPEGIAGPDRDEQLHMYNPNTEEAAVQLDLVLDSGEAQPFELRVPAHDRVTIGLAGESRIPKGVGHSLLVRVSNGVPIAVGRTIDIGAAPNRRGYISDIGATSAALHWGFAAGGASPNLNEFIAVTNEATSDVRVDVTGTANGVLDALPGLSGVNIPRGGRAVFYLGDHGVQGDRPIVVNASGPVVVERTTLRPSGVGASSVIGAVLTTDHG
jgi:hypothetical protein